jgi:NhaP-type Na+/H+ and K+/H+ antiporter
MSPSDEFHPSAVEASEELIEITGGGLRVVEVGLVVLLGLLVCPPLMILAVVVAVPAIAISALVAAVAAAVVVPTMLVRRVRAHHREHGRTLFVHRLVRR